MKIARIFDFAGHNPCEAAKCDFYEQCAINRQGIATCECGPECEPVMRPVCARGGTTYTSMCELKRQACLTRSNIEVAYVGICGSRGPCSEKVSLSIDHVNVSHAENVRGREPWPKHVRGFRFTLREGDYLVAVCALSEFQRCKLLLFGERLRVLMNVSRVMVYTFRDKFHWNFVESIVEKYERRGEKSNILSMYCVIDISNKREQKSSIIVSESFCNVNIDFGYLVSLRKPRSKSAGFGLGIFSHYQSTKQGL